MGVHLDRAMVLRQQSRHDLAVGELRQELAEDPDNAVAHAFLGLCLEESERLKEATEEARIAISLAPNFCLAHYALANALHSRGELREARAAAEEAIRLDSEDADYFALLAHIQLDQGQKRGALESAEHGLALDPENVACTNVRSVALVRLGRKKEATATLESALSRDPENALTHASVGWTLLHRAEYSKALEHFREALRLNPDLEWAREGIVEALKARHLVYGLMLRYFLWMSRLSGRAQWGVILGWYLAYLGVGSIAKAFPSLSQLIGFLLMPCVGFVILTWVADPLFDLLLRLNSFGRLSLSRDQIAATNWLAGFIAVALVTLAVGLATGHSAAFLAASLAALLILPVAGTFRCEIGWPRNVMAMYTAALTIMGVAGLAMWAPPPGGQIGSNRFGSTLYFLCVPGTVAGMVLANILTSVRPKGGSRA